MGDVFGGSESKPKAVDTLTAEQQAVSKVFGPWLEESVGKGLQKYPGQLSAELGPDFDYFKGSLGSLASISNQEYLNTDYLESYFNTNIKDPMLEAWEEEILPEIGGAAGRGGFFYGSGREELERESAEQVLETMSAERSKLYWDAELAKQTERMHGQEVQLGAATAGIETALAETAVEQGILTREQMEWLRTQPEYNVLIPAILSYLGTPMTQVGTEQSGAGLGYGIATGLASGVSYAI